MVRQIVRLNSVLLKFQTYFSFQSGTLGVHKNRFSSGGLVSGAFYELQSYREVLKTELLRRKTERPSYSMRAFARDIGITPPRLSEVLRGNEGISEKTAENIAVKLKLKPRQKRYWMSMVQKESSRSEILRRVAEKEFLKIKSENQDVRLSEEEFSLISDWWMGAVLEVVTLSDFKPEVDWISSRCGMPVGQVNLAIERLTRLGLLEIQGQEWRVRPEAFAIGSDVPNSAIRKFHRQVIEKSLFSLLHENPQCREFNSVVLAVDVTRLAEFKTRLRDFFNDFVSAADSAEKNELYGLSVQFFPISRKTDPEGKC